MPGVQLLRVGDNMAVKTHTGVGMALSVLPMTLMVVAQPLSVSATTVQASESFVMVRCVC